jgi:hypothetical protein
VAVRFPGCDRLGTVSVRFPTGDAAGTRSGYARRSTGRVSLRLVIQGRSPRAVLIAAGHTPRRGPRRTGGHGAGTVHRPRRDSALARRARQPAGFPGVRAEKRLGLRGDASEGPQGQGAVFVALRAALGTSCRTRIKVARKCRLQPPPADGHKPSLSTLGLAPKVLPSGVRSRGTNSRRRTGRTRCSGAWPPRPRQL